MTKTLRPADVWSTPVGAPTYPRYPIAFRDCSVLSLQYRTDPEAIRTLLPAPLEATGDTVLINVGRWGDVPGLGSDMLECNVMIGARLRTRDASIAGAFSPFFFLDNDRAIALGREVQGQPKRLAIISLEDRDDLHVGTVAMNGIEILTGTMAYKSAPAPPEAVRQRVDMRTNINFKVIPHIDRRMAVSQLVARDLEDIDVSECWTGPCTVDIRPHAGSPLHLLPVVEYLEGYYWRASFSLTGGVVLHDYLAEDLEGRT